MPARRAVRRVSPAGTTSAKTVPFDRDVTRKAAAKESPWRINRDRSRSRARDSRPLTVPTGHSNSSATSSLVFPSR